MSESPLELVFATNNPHKLSELRCMVSDRFRILSLQDIGCHEEIPETADTLEGNSLIKARWVKEKFGKDCIADDTGLMVDSLGGAPGVMSARFAGPDCRPEDNMALLLDKMKDVEDRKARFRTVITLIKGDEIHRFTGEVEGEIALERSGREGFGYDPIFIASETGKSFASMTPEEKNCISHRGKAVRKLMDYLQTL